MMETHFFFDITTDCELAEFRFTYVTLRDFNTAKKIDKNSIMFSQSFNPILDYTV